MKKTTVLGEESDGKIMRWQSSPQITEKQKSTKWIKGTCQLMALVEDEPTKDIKMEKRELIPSCRVKKNAQPIEKTLFIIQKERKIETNLENFRREMRN